jgi:hypothetical protein
MRRTFRAGPALALVACFLLLSSCSREQAAAPTPPPSAPPAAPAPPPAPQPFRVARIDLGPSVDANKRVTDPTAVFKPADTIYASVVTEGQSPSVTILAKWTYEDGQAVSQGSQTIAPTGPAATEFHISRPSGWPPGRYQVEIVANGASAGVQSFEVRE